MNAPSTAIATRDPQKTGVSYSTVEMTQTGGGGALMPRSFGDVVAFAAVMARSDVAIPKFLRGNDGACLAITMRALRWEMDPFAVAAKAYSVNDMIAYEAQLIAAVVHVRAPIARRPDYEFSGDGETRKCIVSVEMLDGTTKTYESPRKKDIKVQNSPLWKADLDQQLGYFSIRSWARRHTPEVILGVYTPDELIDHRENIRGAVGTGMRARLEARTPVGGFDADHVTAELDAALDGDRIPDFDAQTGEIIDAQIDPPAADELPVRDDTPPADDFPGDRSAPREPDAANNGAGAGSDFDVIAWAAAFVRSLPGYAAVDPMREDWQAHKDELRTKSPALFKEANRAVADRAAEIAGA